MRPVVKEFARIFSEVFDAPEPIYEFGAFRVDGQDEIADLRPLFPKKEFVGLDMREGLGVDKIANLHDLSDFEAESVGTILMLDTLEHVEFPHKAMAEVQRLLKPESMIIISSVMNFRIHAYPDDYFRYTPSAFYSMLDGYDVRQAYGVGRDDFPHTVAGIGIKSDKQFGDMKEWERRIEDWKRDYKTIRLQKTWKDHVLSLIPPIAHPLLRRDS